MLATLLVGAALARPPQLSLMAGPVVGSGTSSLGTYFSAAPATAITLTWNLGPLESWLGASGSLLMAGSGEDVVPASLLQGEVGVGLGGAGFAGGVYGGNGLPGPVMGLYARGSVKRHGWLKRIGLESRLFYTEATGSTGLALLLRLEPAWPGSRRPEPDTRGADNQPAVPVSAESPAAGGEGLAYPYDTPPVDASGDDAKGDDASGGEGLAYPVDAPPAPASEEAAPDAPPAPTHHPDPY